MKKKERKRREIGFPGERIVSGRSSAAVSVFLMAGLCLRLGVLPVFADVPGQEETSLQTDPGMRIQYSEIVDREDHLPVPDQFLTDEEGDVWKLKSSQVVAVPYTGRSRKVSGEVVYPEVTKNAGIPETAAMEVEDEESGQTFTVSLPLTDTEYEKERWNGDLEFTVTFHSYGADIYSFGETKVPHRSEQPPLTECREELMAAIGMPEEDCRLEEFCWAGEAYTDEKGILCRDAAVRGSRRVWDCHAVYEGEVKLPDVNRYRLQMEYTRWEEAAAAEEVPEAAAAEVSSVSDGSEADGRESFLQWLLHHGWTVSIGLFALLLAVLGFLLLKRRAETLDGKN